MTALVINTREEGVLDHTTLDEVRDIAYQVVQAEHAVLHVHGGLVSRHAGVEAAERLSPFYATARTLSVFPVWESGLAEVLRNHAAAVFNETLFRTVLKLVLKHAGGKIRQLPGARQAGYVPLHDRDVRGALGRARAAEGDPSLPEPLSGAGLAASVSLELTDAEAQEFEADLDSSQELQDALDGVMLGLGLAPPLGSRAASPMAIRTDTLLSAAVCNELRQEWRPGARGVFSIATLARHAVVILARVIRRFVQHRDHGLYTTCVEEVCRELYLDAIGGQVWQWMKRDAEHTFRKSAATADPHGGRALLDGLAEALRTTARTPQLSIVAHSAGAIWTCHFLQQLDQMRRSGQIPVDFQLDRLILLAPACTTSLFDTVLKVHAQSSLFSQFRMFALSDAREAGYWEAPPLYPRSLLYLVSGLLEEEVDAPLLGMQRYVTDAEHYTTPDTVAVRQFLTHPATRAVYAPAAGEPGLCSDALRHGGFAATGNPQPSTMTSVLYALTHERQ